MKAWEKKKAEWGPLSKQQMLEHDYASDFNLSPEAFQARFQEVLRSVIEKGVALVGMTSGSTNRLAYCTKEITSLVHRARLLTAAKRETYLMTTDSRAYTCAQRRA
eukprot:3890928-Rhodomonas_salina.1